MTAHTTDLRQLLAARRFDAAEQVCRLRLQNAPDDAEALGFLLPWLMDKRELLQARVYAETAVKADGSRRELLMMLGQVRERMRDLDAARAAFAAAAALHDDEWVALLFLAEACARAGAHESALSAHVQALHRAERVGALLPDAGLPHALQARLQHAFVQVQQARATHLDAALAPLSETHGEAAIARIVAAKDALVGRRPRAQPHPLQHPTLLCIPDLPPRPWFERDMFPFLAEIERDTDLIRDELLALLADDADMAPYIDMPERAPAAPIWRELNRSPRWRGYHFHRHGIAVAEHHARCPRTAAALERLPLLRIPEHSPEAMFSLLAPHTAIPPHTGVINGRLTVHLPLIVPEDCGALKSGDEARPWQEGRCMVFDDSFVHEAWNHSAHLRAVLIFDIWHPDLSTAERDALSTTIDALGTFNRRHDAERGTAAPR